MNAAPAPAPNMNVSRFSAARNSLGRFATQSPSMNSAAPATGGWGGILLVLVVLVALFAVYYNTIGYYINLGWKKLSWSRERGETVEIDVPGGARAELVPAPAATQVKGAAIGTGLEKVMDRIESDVEAALGDGPGGKQVFNVNRNVYTFGEAEPLCRAFGAELATYDQVKDAYKAGADWCNYGWV